MASTDEMRTAGLVRRGLSIVIDILFGVAATAVTYLVGFFDASLFSPPPDWFWTEWWLRHWLDAPSSFFGPIVFFAVTTLIWTSTWEGLAGRTPGDRLAGIRVVDGNGERPGAVRVVLRALGVVLNLASLGLGWLWIVVSPSRRGWHDLLSGTWVVLSDR